MAKEIPPSDAERINEAVSTLRKLVEEIGEQALARRPRGSRGSGDLVASLKFSMDVDAAYPKYYKLTGAFIGRKQ